MHALATLATTAYIAGDYLCSRGLHPKTRTTPTPPTQQKLLQVLCARPGRQPLLLLLLYYLLLLLLLWQGVWLLVLLAAQGQQLLPPGQPLPVLQQLRLCTPIILLPAPPVPALGP